VKQEDLPRLLRELFQKYRTTVWFRVTYLVVLGLLVAQLSILTVSAVACLVLLLMPITTFIVPYWLGERKLRRFAVNALPVFAIAILVAAAMSTQALLSQDQTAPLRNDPAFLSEGGLNLTDGNVTPYRGPPPGPFTFRVRLTTTASSLPENFSVFLNLTVIQGVPPALFERPSYNMTVDPVNATSDTRGGVWYEVQRDLTDSIYGFAFSVTDRRGNWTTAGPDFGPLTASGWTYYGFFLYFTALSLVFLAAFGLYYSIVFLWWYTTRAREARAKYGLPAGRRGSRVTGAKGPEIFKTEAATGLPKAGKATAFTCTNCGADVSETDVKCPKCGATFED
jgi:hypothetical protein